MGDRNPPLKSDEQYPLLKVDGGGDMSHVAPAQVTPEWGVTCKKTTRFTRWPEFISACWMTFILCGISFLVFHALGMGFHRRQQFIIVKCEDSKQARNVYYHQIIPRGSQIPFVLYTEYLSNIATKYPLLRFNVIFLIDDIYPELARSVKRNYPAYHSWFHNYKLDDITKDAYNAFKKRYRNVNVTVLSLCKFMAKTPLKYKWRLIPQAHLSFYARVYSVWQNGGIGMDIRIFNNDFHNGVTDSRIDAILRQHNDGINPAAYTKALNKIDQDEASASFNVFTGIINHFLIETRSFFNRTLLPISFNSNENTSLVRTHRSKRESRVHSDLATEIVASTVSKDFYRIDNSLYQTTTENEKDKTGSINVSTSATTENITKSNTTDLKIIKSNENASDTRPVVLFYDFSITSNSLAGLFSSLFKQKSTAISKSVQHLLSIDTEGSFIAASLNLHPFLGHLTSAGYFGMHPKFAIQDALLSQCSGVLKEDVYCNSIYIL